jgi:hypothetical protein
MPTGAGLGGLVSAVLPLVGIVTILRRRSRRKRGVPDEPEDASAATRRAATRESERRMQAYLAQRSPASYHDPQDDEQETRR